MYAGAQPVHGQLDEHDTGRADRERCGYQPDSCHHDADIRRQRPPARSRATSCSVIGRRPAAADAADAQQAAGGYRERRSVDGEAPPPARQRGAARRRRPGRRRVPATRPAECCVSRREVLFGHQFRAGQRRQPGCTASPALRTKRPARQWQRSGRANPTMTAMSTITAAPGKVQPDQERSALEAISECTTKRRQQHERQSREHDRRPHPAGRVGAREDDGDECDAVQEVPGARTARCRHEPAEVAMPQCRAVGTLALARGRARLGHLRSLASKSAVGCHQHHTGDVRITQVATAGR